MPQSDLLVIQVKANSNVVCDKTSLANRSRFVDVHFEVRSLLQAEHF